MNLIAEQETWENRVMYLSHARNVANVGIKLAAELETRLASVRD